MIYKGDGLA